MDTSAFKLSNRGKFTKTMITAGTAILVCLSYFVAIYAHYGASYPSPWAMMFSSDMLLTFLLIAFIWSATETTLKLNEVYRSRPYSYILFLNILESVIGVSLLLICITIFGLPFYGRVALTLFAVIATLLVFSCRVLFYYLLRHYRKKGFNQRSVIFVCDKGGERLLALINRHFEWGYKVQAIVGDDYMMEKMAGKGVVLYPISTANFDEILTQDIDDLIYAREDFNSSDVENMMNICQDYGITFRLYSAFFNRMSSQAYLRYFDTNAVLTIANTPTNYVGLLCKRLIDIGFSSCVILCGLPFFLIIMLLIKLDSKGPVFFLQKRTGLKGKEFYVYKFRTMVTNAEELKAKLMAQNEMTGPVFKMTNDPRITRMGRILRKTGIDEFPQFLNVFIGNMSIVGPRPPLPSEVAQYERWQMRRLAMKPGITCLWQVAPNRNSITFEEWMKMDMEYIDNWSLTLDFLLIFRTVSTMVRADGK